MIRPALLVFAAALPLGAGPVAEPLETTTQPIQNFAIASTEQRFGPLEFLGGIEIVSPDSRLGGISGVEIVDGGARAYLATDSGDLIVADLVHENGDLVGLDNAEIERLVPDSGRSKDQNDIEDFALNPNDPSTGAIVLERRDEALMSFGMENGRPADFEVVPLFAELRILRSNKGLESVAFAPPFSPAAGSVVVIAERDRTGEELIPGWIVGSGAFHIVERDDFDVSSARFLPDGDLLLLERRYTPGWGVALRIRRIPGETVVPGGELDGEILLDAGMLHQIDNMEGLSIHQDPDGRAVLTLVSDDNKSFLQRTLMLQFALSPEILAN